MVNENNQKSSPLRGTFVEGQNVRPKGGEGLLPRGLRNNNPLNIRHSKSKWKGMRKTQTDSAFVQFETMAYGYRAAFVLLRTYRVKYGYNTIRKIIGRWAPSSENNTERYIQNVSQWTGIDADKLIAGHDANAMIRIVAAMSRMENGRPSLPFGHLTHTRRAHLVLSDFPHDGEGFDTTSNEPYSDKWMMEQIAEGWRLANSY